MESKKSREIKPVFYTQGRGFRKPERPLASIGQGDLVLGPNYFGKALEQSHESLKPENLEDSNSISNDS